MIQWTRPSYTVDSRRWIYEWGAVGDDGYYSYRIYCNPNDEELDFEIVSVLRDGEELESDEIPVDFFHRMETTIREEAWRDATEIMLEGRRR